ncbi:hypothetical protein [Opitutus terrae]|uniref:Uncharacterized protein n=1 Tax=Opitutus terrae (strain DSM 11246 / JCM 15787 / PB90-1) TaxID=452637 RepID=B1ZV52_OPITP|nr:hypothetical protein [Opitutus terrae]ACB76719.1 hypothetical protein Oter_3442 [Opitutus terrae PB90-1]
MSLTAPMISRLWIPVIALLLSCASASERRASVGGIDTGLTAKQLIETTDPVELARWGATGAWLRIRNVPQPADSEQWTVDDSSFAKPTEDRGRWAVGNPWTAAKRAWAVHQERRALGRLCELGFHSVPLVSWANSHWTNGVRPRAGRRTPLDLREAFERARRQAGAYGDVVAALEFDNEPDLMFVAENPETYTAFLKACYLGVRESGRTPSPSWESLLSLPGFGSIPQVQPGRETRAVMAPVGFPPGPFFEAMVANGFWGYTDAFNYHYYGYAEDFSRVYHLFRVVAEEASLPASADATQVRRELPVILTEYGYGGLTGVSAQTVEGRTRQWQWFRDVAAQIREERIAGAMAFYLRPYYEREAFEFGLTTKVPVDGGQGTVDGGRKAGDGGQTTVNSGQETVNGGQGTGDGERSTEPQSNNHAQLTDNQSNWTERIGKTFGGNAATPALAWLLDQAEKQPYQPKDWTVATPKPSPVVIDFIAGKGIAQVKRYRGYLALPAAGGAWEGELVLYNFSHEPQRGRIVSETSGANGLRISGIPETLVLEPMERRAVPVTFARQASRFARAEWRVRFEPDTEGEPASVFATAFYPDTAGMREHVVSALRHDPATASGNRERLLSRTLASEEPAVGPAGRWLLTPGVTVTETSEGIWQFVVQPAPESGPYLRALAQLPLPDDFVFPDEAGLRLDFRLAQPAGTSVGSGRYFEIALRTANDNTYVVWPWSYAVDAWTTYLEMKENFGLVFYNRANLPWRFRENRPVALEFGFGRTNEELVYEVRAPRFMKIGKANGER